MFAFQIVINALRQAPKLRARRVYDESSVKATKSVGDPHAPKSDTGRTARRIVVNSEPTSVLMCDWKSVVETW